MFGSMGLSAWKHKRECASRVGNCPQFSYPQGSWKTSLLSVHSPHPTIGENAVKRTFGTWHLRITGLLLEVQPESPVAHFVLGRQLCPEQKMTVRKQVICILLLETIGLHPQIHIIFA